MNLRINSCHTLKERAQNAYFTPIEAVASLIDIEDLPASIHEPACGDGAIALPLRATGREVSTSDIIDYGLPGTVLEDYLAADPPMMADGIVTNPPFTLAIEFARKAVSEVPYVALLLRLNWLETPKRRIFFKESKLSRVWVSSRRLPMMHRHGWEGAKSTSNQTYAWFCWDFRPTFDFYNGPVIKFFDWREHYGEKKAENRK